MCVFRYFRLIIRHNPGQNSNISEFLKLLVGKYKQICFVNNSNLNALWLFNLNVFAFTVQCLNVTVCVCNSSRKRCVYVFCCGYPLHSPLWFSEYSVLLSWGGTTGGTKASDLDVLHPRALEVHHQGKAEEHFWVLLAAPGVLGSVLIITWLN